MAREPRYYGDRPAASEADDIAADLHTDHLELSLEPTHPATGGSAHFAVTLDGETIVRLAVDLGYHHRGFEKQCEAGNWTQAVPYTDRLNYHSAILANTAYCMAVESLLELEIPVRAQWLRVLGCELARIGDHLRRLSALARGLSLDSPAQWLLHAREFVLDLHESLAGARVTAHYVRIGGVCRDMAPEFRESATKSLAQVKALLADFDAVATQNRVFVERLKGTGVLSREDCLQYGFTGPLLRATGLALDLRKADAYLTYGELDFDVPVGREGDNFDRYLVCLEETRQSLSLVAQCLEHLERIGPGAIASADDRLAASFEEPGLAVPVGDAYFAVESANGELGFYIASDGSARPLRVHCRAPSFAHLQPLEKMMRGHLLADLVPTLALLNIVGAECDR